VPEWILEAGALALFVTVAYLGAVLLFGVEVMP